MMLNVKVARVVMTDGTTYVDVKMIPGDLVALERQFGIRAPQLQKEQAGLEHYCFMAWRPLHRTGKTGLSFDEFCDQVEDIDIEEMTANTKLSAGPTPPVPSGDDSSS